MFCGKCGKEIIDGAKFCAACGTPVEEDEPGVQSMPENNAEMGKPAADRQMEAAEMTGEGSSQRKAGGKMDRRNPRPAMW